MRLPLRTKHLVWGLVLLVIILIGAYCFLILKAANPVISPSDVSDSIATAPSVKLPWPSYGQSAIGLNNSGAIDEDGQIKSVPMASTAKLITALCVLQKYPLTSNDSGPTITLGAADVSLYNSYQAEAGSDLLINSGEQLSERQMLEAMLLPSADNIADSLATWAFGSLANYRTYAGQYLASQGLNDTHIGVDASGFDPSSTTSATNLVSIGEIVMDNPVLSNIVGESFASGFPLVGNIKNVNELLGKDDIVGIKTGNTDQAGGVYLSASNFNVNGQNQTLITAIMQAPSLFDAEAASLPLITAAQSNFALPSNLNAFKSGDIVGKYYIPWNKQSIYGLLSQSLNPKIWGGSQLKEAISLNTITDKSKSNEVVGNLRVTALLPKLSFSVPITLSSAPTNPSAWWKLTHPKSFLHL